MRKRRQAVTALTRTSHTHSMHGVRKRGESSRSGSRSSTSVASDGGRAGHVPPRPIPHTLAPVLCLDFVNSLFSDHTGSGETYDRLEMAQWQRWFADRSGVSAAGAPPPEMLREMIRVRRTMRELLESQAMPDDKVVRRINRTLAGAPRTLQLSRTRGGFTLEESRPRGWEAVLAAVLASYAELLSGGQIERVRRCANPDCSWLFYDESRNASRRWCDPASCGNLHGVRVHRERARRSRRAATGQR